MEVNSIADAITAAAQKQVDDLKGETNGETQA